MNYIIRVIGKDLDGTKRIEDGIQGIDGISQRMGIMMANQLRKENKIAKERKLGHLNPEEIKKLEDIILFPEKHSVPSWALNRQKDVETGKMKHLTMNDLAFSLRLDLQRLAEIKSYRGLRHMWGLPVRGQKTKSTHRGKGGSVGVSKKQEAKPGAAPAKAAGGDKKK